MRAPPLLRDFFEWRWAPCVGLTAGSLAFVVLALLLIPTRFEGALNAGNSSDESALLDRTSAIPPRAYLGASLPRSFPSVGRTSEQASPSPVREERAESPPALNEPAAPQARGFSPIIDRPAPPPAPAPPPVEVAPPPLAVPVPASNVVIQQPQQPDADGPRREVTVQ